MSKKLIMEIIQEQGYFQNTVVDLEVVAFFHNLVTDGTFSLPMLNEVVTNTHRFDWLLLLRSEATTDEFLSPQAQLRFEQHIFFVCQLAHQRGYGFASSEVFAVLEELIGQIPEKRSLKSVTPLQVYEASQKQSHPFKEE